MNEIWKKTEWDYEVSSEGRVRNSKTRKILKQNPDASGKPVVTLWADGGRYTVRVAKLIYLTFHNLNFDGIHTAINHRDADFTNCRLENLELLEDRRSIRTKESKLPRGITRIGRKSYRVTFRFRGEWQYLGTFYSLDDAKAAYQKKLNSIRSL